MTPNQVSDSFQLIITGIWIGVWVKKKVVNTFKLLAVNFCVGSQLKHSFQTDGRFLTLIISFSNEAWPHCIVKLWVIFLLVRHVVLQIVQRETKIEI
jgi:hypothetical protein